MSSDSSEFNTLLLTAIDKALDESMGQSVGGALKAYIPVSIVSTDPRGFATKLERLTGGNKLVEHKIMRHLEELIAARNAQPMAQMKLEQMDFGKFVETCRVQFVLK
jgi:hypothetical protein